MVLARGLAVAIAVIGLISACASQDVGLRQQVDAQATEIALLRATPAPLMGPTSTPTAQPALAAPTAPSAMLRRVAPSVVRIVTESGEGTGFFFQERGEILTAFHVVESPSN